jgi:hypothetical protein
VDPAHIDADRRRCIGIRRARPQVTPKRRVGNQNMNRSDDQCGNRKADNVNLRHGDRPQGQRHVGVVTLDRPGVGAKGQYEGILQDNRNPEGGHHRRLRAFSGKRHQQELMHRKGEQRDSAPNHQQSEKGINARILDKE